MTFLQCHASDGPAQFLMPGVVAGAALGGWQARDLSLSSQGQVWKRPENARLRRKGAMALPVANYVG